MKGCLALALIAAAATGGGYAVYANPALPAQAVHAEQQVADWMHSHIAEVPAAGLTPSGVDTAPPTVFTNPSSTANSMSPGGPVWPANGGGAPSASAPPIDLIFPSPSPSPLPATTWTSADCSWATAILTRDAQLDEAEAAAIANGTDTRYGSGPQIVAYYQGYAAEWSKVLGEVEGTCAAGIPPTAAQASDALSWFAQAMAAHEGDAKIHSGDAQWDQDWIGYYARLSTMFAAASA